MRGSQLECNNRWFTPNSYTQIHHNFDDDGDDPGVYEIMRSLTINFGTGIENRNPKVEPRYELRKR